MNNTVQIDFLSLWQSVRSGATQLLQAVDLLPDECECGDAGAHLEGRCSCCGGHKQVRRAEGTGVNCAAILDRLRADIATLAKDFSSLAGPLEMAAMARQRVELRRGVFLAASDLERISAAFERVDHAVMGFRRTCAVAELRRVKLRSTEFRDQCERINADLEGEKSGKPQDQLEPDR